MRHYLALWDNEDQHEPTVWSHLVQWLGVCRVLHRWPLQLLYHRKQHSDHQEFTNLPFIFFLINSSPAAHYSQWCSSQQWQCRSLFWYHLFSAECHRAHSLRLEDQVCTTLCQFQFKYYPTVIRVITETLIIHFYTPHLHFNSHFNQRNPFPLKTLQSLSPCESLFFCNPLLSK